MCGGCDEEKNPIKDHEMRNNSDIDYYFNDDNDNSDHGFNKAAMVELYGRNYPNINRQIQY